MRARAEAEAVALLRNALLDAAAGSDSRVESPRAPEPARPARSDEGGTLFWAYCVMRAADPEPPGLVAVDGSHPVERFAGAGLAALVSRVPRAEFGEGPLRENLNELSWLERVARAHEAVLEQAQASATIVPLRLCTLYDSEASVVRMLEHEQEHLIGALDALEGRQEWSVKVLVDPARLMDHARAQSDDAEALEAELEARGDGGAYMLRRRLERQLRAQADSLAAALAGEVHSELAEWALDAVVSPPQNRELSGHEGEMILNAAYLVESARVEELRTLVAEFERRHGELGMRVELGGPWPPYNFVPRGGTAAIA